MICTSRARETRLAQADGQLIRCREPATTSDAIEPALQAG